MSELAEEILRSRKYAQVDRAVVERICAATVPKFAKRKDVIKAVKKELHIIHESFLQDECHAKAVAILETHPRVDKDIALQLMALHASTKERISQATEIYAFISRYVTDENCVVDIGCGFNPFALPFFTKQPKDYAAFDINTATVQTLNKFFELGGMLYEARLCDAVAQTPGVQGDVLFMFKLFPLLERQEKGRAFGLLRAMEWKTAIVSFPLKSASGKEKGMEAFYTAQFEGGLPSEFAIIERVKFANEMFYVVGKQL